MLFKKIFVLLAILLSSLLSYADVVYVTNGETTGTGSLVDGVGALNSNDTLIINFKGGLALNDPILLENDTNITIIGPGAIHSSFFAENMDELFEIKDCENIVFKGLAFKHPFAILEMHSFEINNSSVKFYDCLFEKNIPQTSVTGGAIYAHSNVQLEVYNCSFFENNAFSGSGGAVYYDNTFGNTGRFENCTFYQNKANTAGGAVFIDQIATPNAFIFQNNTFYENTASLSGGNVGQAIDFTHGAALPFLNYIEFFHNIFYRNGDGALASNFQIYFPGYASAAGTLVVAENNYVLKFATNNEVLPSNFQNNPAYDFEGDTPSDLGLRSTFITDGYGLKYFPIVEATSVLKNSAPRTSGIPIVYSQGLSETDCRRAPRVLLDTVDIGAVEYTPYRVTAIGANVWRDLVNTMNADGQAEHYVSFDLSPYNPFSHRIKVKSDVAAITVPVYIDGFSQEGTEIPGPYSIGFPIGNSSDHFHPATNVVTFDPVGGAAISGITVASKGVTIAGIGLVGFDEYGIHVTSSSEGFKLFGSHIGVEEFAGGFQTDNAIGNQLGGIRVESDSTVIGGFLLHERNVITGNGFQSTTGANLVVSNLTKIEVLGNVIGLAPNAKDSLSITHTNAPDGIRLESTNQSLIGYDYIFGRNYIASHIGEGIYHDTPGSDNTISFNHIGVNLMGNAARPNKNGISINKNTVDEYHIGIYGRNLISGNTEAGILIDSSYKVMTYGNIIGGDSLLVNTIPNLYGIELTGVGEQNTIGGDDFEDTTQHNVIVGNTKGIYIHGSGIRKNHIKGNLIGVAAVDASTALPNTVGIELSESTKHNIIGFEDTVGIVSQVNIISGNLNEGIYIHGNDTRDNIVKSNIIGSTNPNGATPTNLGNTIGVRIKNVTLGSNYVGNLDDSLRHLLIHYNTIGIRIDSSDNQYIYNAYVGLDTLGNAAPNEVGIYLSPESENNTIGGHDFERNVVSGNDSAGIFIDSTNYNLIVGNLIGTDHEGNNGLDNHIGMVIRNGGFNKVGAPGIGNVISGNELGLLLSKNTRSNGIVSNYFGLNESGVATVSGSKVGIYMRNVDSTNFIGLDLTRANFFENDSIDIGLKGTSNQEIKGNILGFNADSSAYLGTAQSGIGISLNESSFNTIGGLGPDEQNAIANKLVGVLLINADTNTIQHNYLGNTPGGDAVLTANNQRIGIGTRSNSNQNTIGPDNVIGGNNVGVFIAGPADTNAVFGNLIGIDTALASPLSNDTAILISGSAYNRIGGESADSANVMVHGVQGLVLRSAANQNTIINNYIGLNIDGTAGPNLGDGIVINDAFDNLIGGADLNHRNYISNSNGNGITIVGTTAYGNALLRNSIYGNNGLGIDIGGGGVPTPNNATNLQHNVQMPIISSAFPCSGASDIQLSVVLRDLTIGDDYYLDIYHISNVLYQDPSLYGEGGPLSIHFDTITAMSTQDTIVIDLSPYGLVNTQDTVFTAMVTPAANRSSSEFALNAKILDQPVLPTINTTTEICKFDHTGIIEVDNSANAIYDFYFLFNGTVLAETSPAVLLVDSLSPQTYAIQLAYANGCTVDTAVTLGVGPSFDLSAVVSGDTCDLDNGAIALSVTPSQAGYFINGFSYSINNGATFGALNGNVFNGLAGNLMTQSVATSVVGPSTCYSDTINNTIPVETIPVGQLNFGYSNFCHDTAGVVTVPPIFTLGDYNISTAALGYDFDTLTGELTGAEPDSLYKILYEYGTCASVVNNVVAYFVPSDTFTFPDLCQNVAGILPVPDSSGGIYSLLSGQPNGTINSVTGELTHTTPTNDIPIGIYEVIYNTNDVNCPRQDTVSVEVLAKAVLPVIGPPTPSNDTVYFCRNLIDPIFSNDAQTVWTLGLTGATSMGNLYNLVDLPVGQDTSLYYFRDSVHISTDVCRSDTGEVIIHLYDIPAQPSIVNGDVEYCQGEALIDLTNATAVNWYAEDLSAIDGVGLAFGPSFQDGIIKYYAQAESAEGCLSLLDSTELTGYNKPPTPTIQLPSVGADTAFFCRNVIDIVSTDFYQTIWGLTPSTNDVIDFDYLLTSLPVGQDTTAYFHRDSIFSVTKTCSSDLDSIVIHLYDIPTQPSIVNGDVEYCSDETLIDLTNATAVNWYAEDLSAIDGVGPSFGPSFQDGIVKYYAQAESVEGCLSLLDSTELTGYDNPPTPMIQLPSPGADTAFFCRNVIDIVSTDFYQTIWGLTPSTNDVIDFDYLLTSLPVGQDTIAYFHRDSIFSVTKTCSSELDSIVIHLYDTPTQPSIVNGDVEYCSDETLIDLTNVTVVNWYAEDLTAIDGVGLLFEPNFQDGIVKYYAQAESAEGCLSLLDSTEITGYDAPPTPMIQLPNVGADTAFFCRNAIDIVSTDFYQTIWGLTPSTNDVIDFDYLLTSLPVGQDTMAYFHRDSIFSVTKTCSSELDSIVIHLYDIPAQPSIVNGDVEYCSDETILNLTNATVVNWYAEDLTAIDGVGLLFGPNFQDGIVKYYAQAESAEGCLSLLDSTEITGYDAPPTPMIQLPNVGADTAFFCRNVIDTVSTDFYQTIWGLTPSTNDVIDFDYLLTSLPVGQDTMAYFHRDSIFSVTKTCSSELDSIVIHLYDIPAQPSIVNGNVEYCEGETIVDLATLSNVAVNWHITDLVGVDEVGASFGPSFQNGITKYYAQAESAEGCLSLLDSTELIGYLKPLTPSIISPILSNDTAYFCRNDLDTIESDFYQTLWQLDPIGTSTSGFFYVLNDVPVGQDTTLYYHRDSIYSLTKTCHSDTGEVYIHLFDVPAKPDIVNGDLIYCEADVELDLTTTIGATMNWYENDTSSISGTAISFSSNYDYALGDSTIVYYVQEVSGEGCKSLFDTTALTFHPMPDAPVLTTTSTLLEFCPEDELDTLFTDIDAHWYFGSNSTIAYGVNDTLEIPNSEFVPGISDSIKYYHVDLLTGCHSDTGSISIDMHTTPNAPDITTIDSTYCDGDLVYEPIESNIGATSTGYWYVDGTTVLASSPQYVIAGPLPLGDTLFYFDYDDEYGCRSVRDSIVIEVFSIPVTPIISALDSVYCEGENYELMSSATETTWFLDHPSNNAQLDPSAFSYQPVQGPGQYYIYTRTTINGCRSAIDSMGLTIHARPDKPNIIFETFEFCDYDDDDTLSIENGVVAAWFEFDNFTDTIYKGADYIVPVELLSGNTVYYAQVVDPLTNCPSLFDSIIVFHYSTDTLTAGEDVYVCKGYEVELNASGGAAYAWSNIVFGQDQPNPTVSPLMDTEYAVGITGHNGCFITDTVAVFMEDQGNCMETVYTAFSPNGDGVNETWIIEGIEGYSNNVVYIYNRWGDLIAKIDNYDNVNNVWDGVNQSTSQPVVHGTYYFLLEIDGKKRNDGWIQVVK